MTLHTLRALITRERQETSRHTYTLFVEERSSAEELLGVLPACMQINCTMPPYTRDDLVRKIWWERYTLPRVARAAGCDRFLSLYQCPTVTRGMHHAMLVHDMIPSVLPGYLSNLRKRFYWSVTVRAVRRATHILTVSEHSQSDIIQYAGIPEKRISVIPVGIDPIFGEEVPTVDVMRIREKYNLDNPYIYIGGGLEVRKNVENAMRGYAQMAQVVREFPDLVISGKLMPDLVPMVTDVTALAQELEIVDKVKILGFVPQEDLPALYRDASLFVFVSSYEGLGLPILEAMSIGTPVLTARNSSLPEVGESAVGYCDSTSPSDIAQKMLALLHVGGEERREMVTQGKRQVGRRTWDKCIRAILTHLT